MFEPCLIKNIRKRLVYNYLYNGIVLFMNLRLLYKSFRDNSCYYPVRNGE
jgi:hypothetical protein